MKIAIVGTGYVGLVTGTCLAEIGHDVIGVDNNKKKIEILNKGGIPIYEPGLKEMVQKNMKAGRLNFTTSIKEGVEDSDIIFIAVGTPPRDDGSADLSYVENVAREIAQHATGHKIVVEKSTVPVKTGEWVKKTLERYGNGKATFDVVSNPEFLREGSAIKDFLNPDRVVIGLDSKKAEKMMKELYAPLNAKILVTDIKSAEIIKHASNSFLATKISFINAVAEICEKSGADVKLVAEGMGLDNRIGPRFLNAGIGYGGSCFPKDVDAFVYIADELGYDFKLLKEVQKVNKQKRQDFIKKIQEKMWILKDKNVGVWGLSFKPNTDDMREAPSIDIINALQKEGANIQAYCPGAMETAQEHVSGVTMCEDHHEAAENADLLLILTEWDHFKNADMKSVKSMMKNPIVLDGRNIFDPKEMRDMGYEYHSIGR